MLQGQSSKPANFVSPSVMYLLLMSLDHHEENLFQHPIMELARGPSSLYTRIKETTFAFSARELPSSIILETTKNRNLPSFLLVSRAILVQGV